MQFCPNCQFMTYTKLNVNSDGNVIGLLAYCRQCAWEGTIDTNDKSIYKRNYQEDFVANRILTNKYTIFDVTLPRVDYDCTNTNCVTNLDIDVDRALLYNDVSADLEDSEVKDAFYANVDKDDIESYYRIRLNSVLVVCKDVAAKNRLMKIYEDLSLDGTKVKNIEYTPPKKEVLYIKYDNINMKYLYICACCGTSWKKK